MRFISFFIIISFLFLSKSYAQKDSIDVRKHNKNFLKVNAIPISLITVGTLISTSKFEKDFQTSVRNFVGNDFNSQLDNYTRYVPIAEIAIADVLGVRSKNHWFDQAKNWTISWFLTDQITFKLKKWIRKPRPSNFDRFSFPSGHTSFAFMNAEVLYNEFKDSSPWLAYSGYVFASGTGALRIMNNAHYLSDVLVASGIGILITKMVYWLDPIIKWNPFKKIKGVTFFPQKYEGRTGFYFALRI
ncbi:phosphatase PAP2 family protein [Pseudotenacibaculum sp. MALMAid0570]|uniref:phosphatase PAP2 family protein n=1 Tax=Pseudotenacibaculum sp. MALMAid0570 TaxID=3143938 RepID=UPI0032DE5815